jgi:hypothetical protein
MVYAQTLAFPFVYEDVRRDSIPLSLAPLAWPTGPHGVAMLSYALTTRCWDAGPTVAHAVSVGWHVLNGTLLWLVARRVVAAPAAVVAAGVFWMHPLQVESVAAVAYRSELVAATALLLSLWCMGRGWLIPAFLCALGAIGGKPVGVMAIALVPIWATWHRIPAWTPTARVYWLAAAFPVLLLVLDRSQALFWARPDDVAQTIAAGWALAARIVLPLRLSIDHDWAAIGPIASVAAVVLTAGLTAVAWQARARVALVLLAWLAVAWLPRLVWQLGEGLHEHHLYTPMVAVSVAVGAWLYPRGRFA